MRLLIVAALVAAAFAARDSERWNHEVRSESIDKFDSFKTGYEYRFHLEAQVSNGLSVPGSQQSAMRSKSLVTVSFPESETLAHLRIEKIRFASLQKEMDQPKEVKPFDLFDEIEMNEEHLRMLRLPLRFRYENGLVSEIEFDREDAEWSKNIKRVYLNMLQINLARKNVSESHRLYSEKDSTYAAPELTLEGDCNVLYTVVPEKKGEKNELLVTKSISFNNCTRRVGHKAAFLPLGEKKNVEKREELEATTLFNYRIRGTPSRFLIKEVELRSVYAYSPLSEENTLFTTFVSGNLRLLEVTKEEKRIPAPKCDKKESLLHSMEWEKKEEKFMATGDESLLKNSPYPEMKNKPEIVSRLVKSLVQHMESEEKGIEVAATHEMGRIVRVLRLASKEDIKRMHKEICESRENPQMKEIFSDALSIAGTFNTVEHLVEKIRARELSPARTSKVLKQLSSLPVPSEKIVRSLLSLCKDSKREPLERQSCWLSVGALINGVCGDNVIVEDEKKCPRDVKERFVSELVEQFERAETHYEKVLALKTLGNSGMDLIVFPLEKIIRDEREEKTVRVQAIEALRKLRSVLPRKMVSILMPLYKNGWEHPEIRVAAFKQIIKTIPDQATIHQIVNQLDRESSTQVHSYVSEALLHYSRSTLPREQLMAKWIQHSLKSLRPRASKKMTSSSFKYFTSFNEENGNEGTLNWATFFSNDSSLPKEIFTSGRWNKHFGQIGFTQHNMDQELYKLLEFVDEAILDDVIVRGKRATSSPTEVLRGLFSKLSIARREKHMKNPHAFVYFRSNDMDHTLLPLDEKILSSMLKTVDIEKMDSIFAKGFRFNTVLSSVLNEQKRTLVHSMGMPLVYSTKMPVIFKVEGEIKAELEPRKSKSVEGVRVHLQARPSVAATHVTKVEIMNPLVNLGVKILHSAQFNLPVDVKTEMNWKNKFTVKTTAVLPKESQRLVQLQTRPVSFVRVWPKETRVYVQPKEKTIYVDQLETLVHRIQDSYLEKATGIKVNVEGHYHGHIFEKEQDIPEALLIGENNVEVRFEKTSQTPKEYVFNTEIDLFNEETRMSKPKMERFLQKEEHLETEDYEEFEESERSRRVEFERYVKEYKGDEKSYSHRFFSEVKSVGGRKEHTAKIEVNTQCDARMRHCSVKVDGMATPFLEKETRAWTIDSEMEMLYPEMPKSLKNLAAQKHRELSVNIQTRWGSDEKNEFRMKIQGEQNKEQKKWMKMVAEMRDEEMTPMEEYYRLIQASMLNQYKAVIMYDIKCPVSYGLINRVYTHLKANAPVFSTTIENGHSEKNTIRAKLTLEPATRQYANISIHTPTEKVTINDLSMPITMPLVNIRRQSVTPYGSVMTIGNIVVDSDSLKPTCTVESNKINSFDFVNYRTPLTTCYSLLAKDCSSENFAVLIKKITENGEEKKMKIVSKKSVIEMEMDKRSKMMRITIDGEEVKGDFGEKLAKAGIYKIGDFVVTVNGVEVEFDGYTAKIIVEMNYKDKMCGLCGHFDGEKKKSEFRTADNEETDDLEEFSRSYLVNDEECKMEEEKLSEKRNYGIESEEYEEEEEENNFSHFESKNSKKSKKVGNDYEEESVEPEQKTRVIEYSNRVCFSKKPVPDCPEKTVADQDNLGEMKVSFACLSRSDSQTSRFLREARREILDLEDFPESFSETKAVPRTCIAY